MSKVQRSNIQTKKKRWTRQNHVNTIECRNYKRQNAKIENVSECKSHINTIECKNNKLQKQHKCIRFVKSKIQLKMTKMPKRRISKHCRNQNKIECGKYKRQIY